MARLVDLQEAKLSRAAATVSAPLGFPGLRGIGRLGRRASPNRKNPSVLVQSPGVLVHECGSCGSWPVHIVLSISARGLPCCRCWLLTLLLVHKHSLFSGYLVHYCNSRYIILPYHQGTISVKRLSTQVETRFGQDGGSREVTRPA